MPPRPPASVPSRPPSDTPYPQQHPQYPQEPQRAPPPPPISRGMQQQPLPPPPGGAAPVETRGRSAAAAGSGRAAAAANAAPGLAARQRQPRGTPQPANTAPQPGDEVIAEPPSQKIANAHAMFSGLDKITGRIISFDVAINETVQFGALQVVPRVCNTRPPTETQNTNAFIEVSEVTLQGEVRRIFTGWMYASSPGLHAVEHPIYDIWITDCKAPLTKVAEEPAPVPAPQQPPQRPQRPRSNVRRNSSNSRSSSRSARRRRRNTLIRERAIPQRAPAVRTRSRPTIRECFSESLRRCTGPVERQRAEIGVVGDRCARAACDSAAARLRPRRSDFR